MEAETCSEVSLGTLIRRARLDHSVEVHDLAKKMRVWDWTLRRWESDVALPGPVNLARLSQILGIDPPYWLAAYNLQPSVRRHIEQKCDSSSAITCDPATQQEKLPDSEEIVQTAPLEPYYPSEREREIVYMLDEGHTLEEIGNRFGITRERVRQLRNRLEKKGLRVGGRRHAKNNGTIGWIKGESNTWKPLE